MNITRFLVSALRHGVDAVTPRETVYSDVVSYVVGGFVNVNHVVIAQKDPKTNLWDVKAQENIQVLEGFAGSTTVLGQNKTPPQVVDLFAKHAGRVAVRAPADNIPHWGVAVRPGDYREHPAFRDYVISSA